MNDLTDLGYLAVACLAVISIFHLRGTTINTITGRAAAARHVLLATILGIYLFKHAITVLGVAFVVSGYAAITAETAAQHEDIRIVTKTKHKLAARVKGITNKVTTQKTTIKKSQIRRTFARKTPVRRTTTRSFQLATRFSLPPALQRVNSSYEAALLQRGIANYEAARMEVEKYEFKHSHWRTRPVSDTD